MLSPSKALTDRRLKLPIYAREGVSHVWLVEPIARFIDVMRLDGQTYRLVATHGEREFARLEPFEAIELEPGALWPWALAAHPPNQGGDPRTWRDGEDAQSCTEALIREGSF